MRIPFIGRRAAALLGALALGLFAAAPQAGAATPKTTVRPVTTALAAGSSYAIVNMWTGKCVDLPNYGSVGINTPVTQYDCNTSMSGDNQTYQFVYTRTVGSTPLYELRNDKSGLCLDLPNYGSNPAGTHVATYYCAANPAGDNQEFSLTNVYDSSSNYLGTLLQNYASGGLCLDVSNWASNGSDAANNLPLTIYPCYDSSWANYGFDDHLWGLLSATA
jgi:hypothetical protein